MPEQPTDLIDDVPTAFSTLTEHDRVFYSPSISGELYTGPPETLEARTTIAALAQLVFAAVTAQEAAAHAQSWRDYRVGATTIMYDRTSGNMGYLSGFNIKPARGPSGLNIHAEQMAIAKGRVAGLNRITGISVYADPADDDANPLNRPTLAPCGRCVDMLLAIPEADERTLVLGTNLTNDVCELYTLGSLTKRHEPLVSEAFSLKDDQDLDNYDRQIRPQVINSILAMY